MAAVVSLLLGFADGLTKIVLGGAFALDLVGFELLGGENLLPANLGVLGTDVEETFPVDRLEVEWSLGVDPEIVLGSSMIFFLSPDSGDLVVLELGSVRESDGVW